MLEPVVKESVNPELMRAFHRQWYKSIDWRRDLTWRGFPILKNPLDLFVLQEIICETKPDIIIETGRGFGGSALFLRDMLGLTRGGTVISIDDGSNSFVPSGYRLPSLDHDYEKYDCADIVYLAGSSTEPIILDRISKIIGNPEEYNVMVILDSDHHAGHVFKELNSYARFVSPECYLVVEDSNTDIVLEDFGPGPADAVSEFLKSGDGLFQVDEARGKLGVTFNTWLKRVK